MPYLECPGCRLSLYSAATHSWIADVCPVCGASLEGAGKLFTSNSRVRTLCCEFPSTPGSVSSARHALDGSQTELGDPIHASVTLLISELVTNSVRHSKVANGMIELFACITPELIRVEVSDDGEGFDLQPVVDQDSDTGRGLQIVDELADRWGRPTGLRTSVWFEIDRVPAGVQAPSAMPPAGRPVLKAVT
jgi:anti-sigma regulatory factor (Ser/Thr protein kinase)